MTMTVLIPDRLQAPADLEQEILGPDVKILTPAASHVNEIPDEIWSGCDAILAWHELRYDAGLLEKLRSCKVLVRVGVGFDNVDLEAAGRLGIPVCNVPDYGTNDVADHTLALMLALARGLPAFGRSARISNEHWQWTTAGRLQRLSGAVLAIIGLGRIGTAVAMRAKAFGLEVRFYDPYVADGYDKAVGVTRCDSLAPLLADADIISIHTPLTEETYGMVDAEFLQQVKEGAIFINTARGAITDLDALAAALRSGRIRAAGLDVLPDEPPDDRHPLIKDWRSGDEWLVDRLIITPHVAFYCDGSYAELRRKAALEARRVLSGQPPRNCVNQQWLL